MKALVVFLAACLGCGRAVACDIALILAIDVSGSVDPGEYRLQSSGLSRALGDPIVSEALVNANAVVAVVQWSGAPHQEVSIPWVVIRSHADVEALRVRVDAVPRAFRNYSTGIGEAIQTSIRLFETAPSACERRIIDVSGDGPNNEGADPKSTRALLKSLEITVNGLSIEGSEPGLSEYYRSDVIFGPGAFVEVARGFKDFPRAIRRKLLRELADRLALR